ncbi:MAG: hypothetical protein JNM19_14015 [Chitinophagaceae bacterium]|nr:hypothetical protein [Chitinophagaceae bacterium]
MKLLVILSLLATLLLSNSDCGKKKSGAATYKGRLEIAGLCMNYTVALTEGEMADTLLTEEWTDETTNKTYTKVFRLGNPCEFPATIKQGDEFYFMIDTTKGKDCMVCLAYYPTPPKALAIKVVDK